MCASVNTVVNVANNNYTPLPCGPNQVQPTPFMQSTTTTGAAGVTSIPFAPCIMPHAVLPSQPMPTAVTNNINNNTVNNDSNNNNSNSTINTNTNH